MPHFISNISILAKNNGQGHSKKPNRGAFAATERSAERESNLGHSQDGGHEVASTPLSSLFLILGL